MSKSTRNKGKSWSAQDVKRLRGFANGNMPTGLIAWNLGRTPAGVRGKASEKRISLKPTNKSPYNRRKK